MTRKAQRIKRNRKIGNVAFVCRGLDLQVDKKKKNRDYAQSGSTGIFGTDVILRTDALLRYYNIT